MDTELRYGPRSGNVQLKKVRSMDKILKHARNGVNGGRGVVGGGAGGIGGRGGYESEPLLNGMGNMQGVIGGK